MLETEHRLSENELRAPLLFLAAILLYMHTLESFSGNFGYMSETRCRTRRASYLENDGCNLVSLTKSDNVSILLRYSSCR